MDKLFSYAISEWLNDIKKNQLPGILGGVGPMHSLVQLGKLILVSIQAHDGIVFCCCFVFLFLVVVCFPKEKKKYKKKQEKTLLTLVFTSSPGKLRT